MEKFSALQEMEVTNPGKPRAPEFRDPPPASHCRESLEERQLRIQFQEEGSGSGFLMHWFFEVSGPGQVI